MTGLKLNVEKMALNPSQQYAEQAELVNPSNLRRQLVLRLAIAVLFILSSIFYAILTGRSHGTQLQRRPAETSFKRYDETVDDYTDRFLDFIKRYGRKYNSDREMLKRFKAFEAQMREVDQLNRKAFPGVEFGENDFSDWADEEFKKSLLPMSFYEKLREKATFIRHDPPKMERATRAPNFFDWRTKNVVSPVKSQGKCGSCWAFAATATVEASWAIAHQGEMRNLSEQTLLDCDITNNACDGGDEDKAFRFIHRHGLAYADDLPYVAYRQNTCDITGNTTKIEVAYFLHPDEQSMIDWLVGFGPVNIGIAVTPGMRAYKGGVFTPDPDDCKNKVIGLHSMMITGYGTTANGEKYWIVKNSWGDTWGVEHGYIYYARGVNACGIEAEPIGILA